MGPVYLRYDFDGLTLRGFPPDFDPWNHHSLPHDLWDAWCRTTGSTLELHAESVTELMDMLHV